MIAENWTSVAKFTNNYNASIAMAVLQDNGIEAVNINKQDSATMLFGYIEIMVNAKDSSLATFLLTSLIEA